MELPTHVYSFHQQLLTVKKLWVELIRNNKTYNAEFPALHFTFYVFFFFTSVYSSFCTLWLLHLMLLNCEPSIYVSEPSIYV